MLEAILVFQKEDFPVTVFLFHFYNFFKEGKWIYIVVLAIGKMVYNLVA